MGERKADHKHQDSDDRINALEEQAKKLQQEVRDLQKKIETHDHPYSH